MTKPLHFVSPFVFSAFFILSLTYCKEEPLTVINCKVTDKKSGATIEDAFVYMDFQTEKQVSGSLVTEHDYKIFNTDQQGEFHYTRDSDFERIFSYIGKPGYVDRYHLGVKRGEVNDLEIKLAPYDGALRLEITNGTGQIDSIYVIIENPSLILGSGGPLGKIFLGEFPVVIPAGQKHIRYLNLPSEEFTKIHWGFSYFTSLNTSPFRDSVYLALHDTTSFTISF